MTEPKPCYDGGTCRNADLVEELNARIADYIEGAEKVISDKCPTDERHCGCVPVLRMATQCYQNALVLITTLPDCEEAKKIAEDALKNKGVDLQISEARACGEYWVNQLYMLEDKHETLEKDYKDVCQKRIEAADSFSKRIAELEGQIELIRHTSIRALFDDVEIIEALGKKVMEYEPGFSIEDVINKVENDTRKPDINLIKKYKPNGGTDAIIEPKPQRWEKDNA